MTALIRQVYIEGAIAGPLAGETLAMKANIAVLGQPWDGASPALDRVIAEDTAPTVARALDAGATVIGQANMHELAFGITSDNAAYGAVESPFGGIAGGSSGGTAAAIARGLAGIGLGTDTGGSGRLPAAFCGVVGLRPSTGRYPAGGVLNLSPSLDTVSAMASDVASVAKLDAVLAGEVLCLEPAGLEGLRLGRIKDPFWTDLDTRVRYVADRMLDHLADGGAIVEDRVAPGLTDAVKAVAFPVVIAEVRRWWQPFLAKCLEMEFADLSERIASPDVADVFRAVATDERDDATLAELQGAGMERVRRVLSQSMEGLDGLIYPTVPIAAPPLGTTEVDIDGVVHPLFPLLTERAPVACLAGAPAISLPIEGFDARPLGIELLGHPGRDLDLLGCAAVVERALR
ncbi:amidase family protein [Roseobacter weihaiensis]|uniref:amidase family protein n=1 Tax=Roseobacter weihaiensis TaxID=2763262 RepID=UPI001D0A975B|nr:amidase family protein [Roseobacter sp. H9]